MEVEGKVSEQRWRAKKLAGGGPKLAGGGPKLAGGGKG